MNEWILLIFRLQVNLPEVKNKFCSTSNHLFVKCIQIFNQKSLKNIMFLLINIELIWWCCLQSKLFGRIKKQRRRHSDFPCHPFPEPEYTPLMTCPAIYVEHVDTDNVVRSLQGRREKTISSFILWRLRCQN